jgi:hypothetical protein
VTVFLRATANVSRRGEKSHKLPLLGRGSVERTHVSSRLRRAGDVSYKEKGPRMRLASIV